MFDIGGCGPALSPKIKSTAKARVFDFGGRRPLATTERPQRGPPRRSVRFPVSQKIPARIPGCFTNFSARSRQQRDDFGASRGPGRVAVELPSRKIFLEGTMSHCVCGHPEEAHLFGGRCRVPGCMCDRFWPIPEISAQMWSRLMRTRGDSARRGDGNHKRISVPGASTSTAPNFFRPLRKRVADGKHRFEEQRGPVES